MKTQQIPMDVLRELKDVTDEVLAEEAENDEDFARVLESQQKFQEDYAVWGKRAYLPSDLKAE